MREKTLVERLGEIEGSLSTAHSAIAAFIVRSGHKAAFLTAAEMAASVGKSESTVVRFARILGFSGYPELQEFLRKDLLETLSPIERFRNEMATGDRSKLTSHLIEREVANLRAALEGVDPNALKGLVKAIGNSDTCYVLGMRSSRAPATLLGHYLSKVVPKVMLIASGDMMLEQLSWIGRKDLLIAYSYPRYSRSTIEALRIARSYGAKTAAITDSLNAPAAGITDHVLIAPAMSGFYGNSFVAAVAVTNLLLASYVQAQPAAFHRNLKRVEEAASLSERFVHMTDANRSRSR